MEPGKGGDQIERFINETIASFDFMSPQKSVPQLVQLYKQMKQLPTSNWTEQKMKEVKDLIESCSGLWIEAYATEPYAVQGDSIRFNFVLNDRLGAGSELTHITIDKFDTSLHQPLVKNRNYQITKYFFVPYEKEITQPYWLKEKMNEGYFVVNDQQLIGATRCSTCLSCKLSYNDRWRRFCNNKAGHLQVH